MTKKRKRKEELLLVIIILLLGLLVGASGIRDRVVIGRIIKKAANSHQEQMEKIEDLTLLTDQGMVYYKRALVGGQLTYRMRSEMGQGEERIVITRFFNPYALWKNLKPWQFGWLKTGSLNGHKVYLLRSRNLSKIMGSSKGKRVPGELWVDPKDWTLRRVEIFLKKPVPGKVTVSLKDYRRVNGLYIPFVTEISFPPLLTPKEARDLQKKIDEIREEVRKMSGAQKELAKPLVDAYLKTTENLLKGKTFTTHIIGVRVNTGLPDTFFE